jgi:predicted DNA-binding antitoxin AbrB/MazE fold protein
MSLQVEAVYENGTFKLAEAIPLAEGQKVTLTIHPVVKAAQRFCGSLPWTRDAEELHAYLNDPDESSWGGA